MRNAEKRPVHVVDFPANPKDLDGWQQMYDEEDPPCGQTDLPRHHSAQYSVPLRQPKEAQPKAAAASQGQWGTPMEMMQAMMQVMMGNTPQSSYSSSSRGNLPGFKMLGHGGGRKEALMLGDRGTDSQGPESQTPPHGRSGPGPSAPAEKAPAEKAPADDCMDVPAAEADVEEFQKARQKRESTKQLTEIADDAIEKMRKAALQQDACKAWCDSAVKAALKK